MNIKQVSSNRWEDSNSAIGVAILEHTDLTTLRAIVDKLVHLGIPSDHVHNIYFQDNGFGVVKIEPSRKFNLGSYAAEDALDIENGFIDALEEFCMDKPYEVMMYNELWFNKEDNPNHNFLEHHWLEVRKDKIVIAERKGFDYDWEEILSFKNPKLGS